MEKLTVSVDGMMCGMCEAHVNDAIRKNFKIRKVKSSHRKGQTVILTETDISDDALEAALAPTGYRVCGVKREHAAGK